MACSRPAAAQMGRAEVEWSVQVFHPATNVFAKFSVFGAVFLIAGAIWIGRVVVRSPYFTQLGVPRAQPVAFSHEHHVARAGIDCRYCHGFADDGPFAGIPPTKTCMTCHRQLWADSPALAPVRASFRTGEPLAWTRVYDLPDFVYFEHAIHVRKGVGCSTCHGRVDRMPFTWRAATLHMEWCLECHRRPEPHLRPPALAYAMDWQPPPDQEARGRALARALDVRPRTDCYGCHR